MLTAGVVDCQGRRMHLVRNERIKLAATYFNGLAIASAAVGGISQIVTAGSVLTGWSAAAWLGISATLHVSGQVLLGKLRE